MDRSRMVIPAEEPPAVPSAQKTAKRESFQLPPMAVSPDLSTEMNNMSLESEYPPITSKRSDLNRAIAKLTFNRLSVSGFCAG